MAMFTTPRKPVVSVVIAAACVNLAVGASAAQAPDLQNLLKLAGEYHASYVHRVSGVTLEEQYQLLNVTGGKMQSNVRISSEVVLVNANAGLAALRDVFSLDTRPTRPRDARITSLLSSPTATMNDWNAVNRFTQEGAIHFALDIIVKVNEPTRALRFIALAEQPSLKYKLDGKKKINGVEVIGLGFEETTGQDKKYVLGTRRNGRAFGRIWVDPASGAIHETELWVESKGESASAKVKYAPHAGLNLILPTETTEKYDEREFGGDVRDFRGAGVSEVSSQSFQASARYSNPTYHPIDLGKLRK